MHKQIIILLLVIADHGNCDIMINPDGSPNTAHTTNMVPLILVDNQDKRNSRWSPWRYRAYYSRYHEY